MAMATIIRCACAGPSSGFDCSSMIMRKRLDHLAVLSAIRKGNMRDFIGIRMRLEARQANRLDQLEKNNRWIYAKGPSRDASCLQRVPDRLFYKRSDERSTGRSKDFPRAYKRGTRW